MLPIYYSSDEVGAPALNNAAGSVIGVLDGCLISGYNAKPVASITVSAGMATVVCSAHGYTGGVGRLVLIAGATPAGLNGAKQVSVVDGNTFTFSAPGVADGAASGTITAKRAPLGWTKLHSGTNKAIYQRTDPQATAMLLRVDDTGAGVADAYQARTLMVESATDVDTYTAPSPTAVQKSGGYRVQKGASTTASKSWILVGDGRTIYLFTEDHNYPFSSSGKLFATVFGDISSFRSGGDAYACVIGGSDTSGNNRVFLASSGSSSTDRLFIARPTNGLGSSTVITVTTRENGNLLGASGPAYPSDVDGGSAIDPVLMLREDRSGQQYPYRGAMRGLAYPLGNVGKLLHGQILSGLLGSSDSYLCVAIGDGSTTGCVMIKLTSEW